MTTLYFLVLNTIFPNVGVLSNDKDEDILSDEGKDASTHLVELRDRLVYSMIAVGVCFW